MGKSEEKKSSRREFLKLGAGFGALSLAAASGAGILAKAGEKAKWKGKKIKVLTTDGKLLEVEEGVLAKPDQEYFVSRESAHEGVHGRKFTMVIDLAKCKNARKCVEACQTAHHLPKDQEWMKVFLLQDSEKEAPYWFPRPCFHCDNPMCVSVCPVGATYKRTDGVVLIDNQRCIGCKFCMTGCPYSVRVFHWKTPPKETSEIPYSPETGVPAREGTVGKCVFCADLLRQGELPRCVTACPANVIYFGDITEDSVTNGIDTVKFSELVRNRAGYRHLESLGTEPSVFYLPPVDREVTVEKGLEGLDEEVKKRYEHTAPYKLINRSDE